MAKSNWRVQPSIFNPRWYSLRLTTKHLKEIINLYIDKQNRFCIVDYGCGDMPYRELFESYVQKYIGLDLEENPFAEIHILPAGKINIENNSTEVVLSTQVLEHVENPEEYLSECFRILKDDGLLILSTHGYWMYHPTPNDYWRWTSSGLQKIIKQAGFEIVYFKGMVSRSAFGIQLLQDSVLFKIPNFIIPLLALPSQIIMLLVDRLLSTQKSRDKDSAIYITVSKVKKCSLYHNHVRG